MPNIKVYEHAQKSPVPPKLLKRIEKYASSAAMPYHHSFEKLPQ